MTQQQKPNKPQQINREALLASVQTELAGVNRVAQQCIDLASMYNAALQEIDRLQCRVDELEAPTAVQAENRAANRAKQRSK